MARILAIDYGKKRCGIAVSDPDRIIATGLTTVEAGKLMAYIKEYCSREEVDTIVVGEPKQMNNMPSQSAEYIEPFVAELRQAMPQMRIDREDERFTSVIAHRSMIEAGLKKKKRQDKAIVDTISATLILQSYMERTRHA